VKPSCAVGKLMPAVGLRPLCLNTSLEPANLSANSPIFPLSRRQKRAKPRPGSGRSIPPSPAENRTELIAAPAHVPGFGDQLDVGERGFGAQTT